MKKALTTLFFIPMLFGCYARSNGVPLFNSYGWGYNADKVVVQKGDTLYSLSRKYQVPLKSMIELNGLEAPYTLNVGQVLSLPVQQTHTVAKGDTLYSISRKYDVDVTSLSKLNGLTEPYILNVGQVLALPDNLGSGTVSVADNTESQGVVSSYSYTSTRTTPIQSSQTTKSVAAKSPTSIQTKTSSAKKVAKTKTIQKSSSTKTVSVYRKSKFMWPVNGSVVSGFGSVGQGRRNDGINIKAATGTNVKAADKGVVAYAGNELKGFGNLVLIKHADGYITAYAHNDKLYVKKGQTVLRGEKIATVGSTGSVNTPQLHFEVRAGKKAVNPRTYLP
jgi:murein DD-endopeptidase MepM/ murein hydrolase activator NlpD